jgi:fibronectin-binding autotransporter adhesin
MKRTGKRGAAVLAAVALTGWSRFAAATSRSYIGPNNGNFNTAANWTGGNYPQNGDSAFLGNVNPLNLSGNVNVDINSSANTLAAVTINSSADSNYMILNIGSSGALVVSGTETVGTSTSDNAILQTSDASNSAGVLTIAAGNINDTYSLSGTNTSVTVSQSLNVGMGGSGLFAESGGLVTVHSTAGGTSVAVLTLGGGAGGFGTYELSGGELQADSTLVGSVGSGLFNLSGGTLASDSITISTTTAGGSATFDLSGGIITAFNAANPTITVGTGGIFNLQTGGTLAIATPLTVNAGGTINFQGGLLSTGINLNKGLIQLEGNSGTIPVLQGTGGTVQNNSTAAGVVTLNDPYSSGTIQYTLSCNIVDGGSGPLGLSIPAGGGIILTGTNTYSGPTTVAGYLQAGLTSAFSPSSNYTLAGGTLDAATLNVSVGSLSGTSGQVNVAGGKTLTLGATNLSSTFGATLASNGNLVKMGTGTWTYDPVGSSTFSGDVLISSGTLQVGTSADSAGLVSPLGSGTVTDNSLINFASDQTVTPTNLISGTGSVSVSNGTVILSTSNSFSGGVTVAHSEVQVSGSGGSTGLGSGAATINAGGILIGVDQDAFGNGSTAPTSITINGGTVTDLGSADYHITLPNLAFTGGTLSSAAGNTGDSEGNYVLNGNGNGTTATATVTTNAAAATAVISAAAISLPLPTTFIVGAGTTPSGVDLLVSSQLTDYGANAELVTKAGRGLMELTASNSYTGGTAINVGTLAITSDAAINDEIGGLILDGGTLQFVNYVSTLSFTSPNTNLGAASGAASSLLGSITGTKTALAFVGPGTLNLLGTDTYGGGTAINGGTLAIGSDAEINNEAGGLTLAGGTLQFVNYASTLSFASPNTSLSAASGAASSLSGNITGTKTALTFAGPGTLNLLGSNTYGGGTTVSGGALVIGTASALPGKTSLNITAGAMQLATGGGTVALTGLSVGATGTLDIGGDVVTIAYGTTDPIALIASYLAAGFSAGWAGGQVDSSVVAAANASQMKISYSIGYADGADGTAVTTLPSGEIEILPTIAGDAKLQGDIVFGDFQILAQYFGQSGGWDEGNFEYGTTIGFGDFQLLAQNFGATNSALTAGETAAINDFAGKFGPSPVPEPILSVPLIVAGLALAQIFHRRERRDRRD